MISVTTNPRDLMRDELDLPGSPASSLHGSALHNNIEFDSLDSEDNLIAAAVALEGPSSDSVGPCLAGSHIVLKKVFNLSGPSVDLLKAQVKIKDRSVTAIVDSGAESSLISSDIVNDLELPLIPHSCAYRVIGQKSFNTLGTVKILPSINNVVMKAPDFVVFPATANPNISLVLGIDFLSMNCFELCVRDRKMVIHGDDGSRIEIHLEESGAPKQTLLCDFPCYSLSDRKLEEGRIESVPILCNIPTLTDDHMILYTDTGIEAGVSSRVHGLDGVTDPNLRSILMVSSGGTTLKKGQTLGTLNSVYQLAGHSDGDIAPQDLEAGGDGGLMLSLPELTLQQQSLVLSSLGKFKAVFSSGDSDVGLAGVTQHHIKLSDSTPIYQRPRRFPQPISDEIERQCQELNALDIIEPSTSPWSSPVVPVRKKDGTIRMCIDYRKLNRVTIPDKFPVPNLTDSIFGLKGTKFFSRLDLVRGYYQLPIDSESKPVTAFSSQRNHWQFKRLSFGLRNAPAAFQREIQAVLSSFPSNKVVAYIDDILIMSGDFEEHLQLVSKVLQTLLEYNIKIKPSKCEFFKSQVEYLGHIVSSTGIRKTDEYVKKIADYPRPTTVGELREFLGLINFQRKFLPMCSEVQKPLSCLTGGRRSKALVWTTEMTKAFCRLKEDMGHDMELAYPDYSSEAEKIELWVDASGRGAGAYLAQQQGDSHRVIGFASMTFSPTQLNYSTLERELTALRWGIKTFRPFLYGISFILYTDHQPLVHLHNMKLVCSRLARTVEELSDFVFEIRYVPGHLNNAADALSRLNCKVPAPNFSVATANLPTGLILNGLPAPGGGDSLFVSLLRTLRGVTSVKPIPGNEQELRELLVDELLSHPERYNLKLDRDARRALRLMRSSGQLPALDLLLPASKLFGVRIFVYFWSAEPVAYQFEEYRLVIHIQCLSGVHFNPLIEVVNYSPPNLQVSSINSVQKGDVDVRQTPNIDCVSAAEDINVQAVSSLFRELSMTCQHLAGKLPMVNVSLGDQGFCAVLDSGAEISLISSSVLGELWGVVPLVVVDEHPCDIVGFSGTKCPIAQTVTLSLEVGSLLLLPLKFAVVSKEILPHCFLLGLDILSQNNLNLDLRGRVCRSGGVVVAEFVSSPCAPGAHPLLMVCSVEPEKSHVLRASHGEDGLKFELSGPPHLMTGLSSFISASDIGNIQSSCPHLRSLRRILGRGLPPKQWPQNLKQFRYYAKKLSIEDGLLIYSDPEPISVVSFGVLLEVALVVHYDFAHVGRDKLLAILQPHIWHPSRYGIVNDICTTCHQCQIMKEFSTTYLPPILKIQSQYPFQLIAADLVSLPRTLSGFVGILVVVDHFSKWVSVVPIRDKRSVSIVQAFTSQILPFLPTMPTSILTDNGPEFTSYEFNQFLEKFNIHHKLTTPYCPSSNGAVERVNRTIQNLLRSLTTEKYDWDVHLPKAVIVYNSTIHSELSMSPSKFLLTQSHHTSCHISCQNELKETWRVGNPKFLPFEVGQLVLMRVHRQGNLNINKLSPSHHGPYEVTHVHENGVTYQLKPLDSNDVLRAHHSKLRLYKRAPRYVLDSDCYRARNPELMGQNGGEVADGPYVPHIISDSSELLSECLSAYSSDDNGHNMFNSNSSSSSFRGFDGGSCRSSLSRVSSMQSVAGSLRDSSEMCVQVPPHVCRGCTFEAEAETKAVINKPVCVEKLQPSTVIDPLSTAARLDSFDRLQLPPIQDLDELYKMTVLDWVESDWELSSVNSLLMIDEYLERSDLECISHELPWCVPATDKVHVELPCITQCCDLPVGIPFPSNPQPEVNVTVPQANKGVKVAATSDISLDTFEGFDNATSISGNRLQSLRSVVSGNHTDSECFVRQTRSKGAVAEMPYLMDKPSRSRYRKDKYQSS